MATQRLYIACQKFEIVCDPFDKSFIDFELFSTITS